MERLTSFCSKTGIWFSMRELCPFGILAHGIFLPASVPSLQRCRPTAISYCTGRVAIPSGPQQPLDILVLDWCSRTTGTSYCMHLDNPQELFGLPTRSIIP